MLLRSGGGRAPREQGGRAKAEPDVAALWSLGLGEPLPVSALHGRGSGDLLDAVLEALPQTPPEPFGIEGGPRRVALVGRPNVGKSSLLNRLAGQQRAVVNEVAGTTRDPVDELVTLGGTQWRFVDTAGIRRRGRESQGADYFATLRAAAALERAEVGVVLVDASQPLTEQDLRIVSMVIEAGRALVIAYNKWDLVDMSGTVTWSARSNVSFTRRAGRRGSTYRRPAAGTPSGWCPRLRRRWPDGKRACRPGGSTPGYHRSRGDETAAGSRRPRAEDPLRHPGRGAAAALRAVHDSLPRHRLPPVPERKLREEFGFAGSPVHVSMRDAPQAPRADRACRRIVGARGGLVRALSRVARPSR